MRIFGWIADVGGCGFYRIMLPIGCVEEMGLAQTTISPQLQRKEWHNYDVLVGQRVYKPGPTEAFQALARMDSRPLLVYEVDDDLLGVPAHNPAAVEYGHPQAQENIRRNIEVADLVTVSTPYLAERLAAINPKVVVLPNCIPRDLLSWQRGTWADRFTVGWAGSSTHDQDWKVVAPAVQAWFRKDRPERVELHTMGAVPKTFRPVPGHRHTNWDPHIPRYHRAIDWHVALAPLSVDRFNRSKSDLRVLEAAMLGIPTIASAVPAYRESVVDGRTGFLVTKPVDWQRRLDTVLNEPDTLRGMGEQAWAWAHTRTIEGQIDKWLGAYRGAGAKE